MAWLNFCYVAQVPVKHVTLGELRNIFKKLRCYFRFPRIEIGKYSKKLLSLIEDLNFRTIWTNKHTEAIEQLIMSQMERGHLQDLRIRQAGWSDEFLSKLHAIMPNLKSLYSGYGTGYVLTMEGLATLFESEPLLSKREIRSEQIARSAKGISWRRADGVTLDMKFLIRATIILFIRKP
ncbi:hypothetical protein QR680_004335 [Steinernema hermaphroditum]|uniref:Uncharacterized protein n=1 Tax=Steinernema hermaphroditum TaxID=289476 RepID=A0AA39HPE9_9BILA|nr:hypothetical protein QR680_004335 [Steinernema hermaphroditum]